MVTKTVTVNETLTRQVASLAKLELSAEEVETFTRQLGDILGYVSQLQEIDVQGIEPLIQPIPLSTAFREDESRPGPRDSEGDPKVLKSAPDVLQSGYKVPPIL